MHAQMEVRATEPASLNLQQNFAGIRHGNRYFRDLEGLAWLDQAGRKHGGHAGPFPGKCAPIPSIISRIWLSNSLS